MVQNYLEVGQIWVGFFAEDILVVEIVKISKNEVDYLIWWKETKAEEGTVCTDTLVGWIDNYRTKLITRDQKDFFVNLYFSH